VRRARFAICAFLAFLPALVAAAEGDVPHPLLEFAHERVQALHEDPDTLAGAPNVREAEHALGQAHAPPDAECAGSIGALRFANLHAELAAARSGAGDFAGAAAAYRSARACRPRDAFTLSALSGALFDSRDFAGARAAIDEALAIDPRSVSVNRLAGNLDFVDERWADAIARFRYVSASDPDRNTASYGQLMLWLAQARGGVAHPEFVARTPGEGWPQPLLLYMRGEYTEAELLIPIKEGDNDYEAEPHTSTDERLCEALYYVGEAYWARGKPEVARDYFAALVNIKVIYFLEHGLALAEIAKLREKGG
jgi:tetratricopeptide (TPR) repeat protein